MIKFNDQAELSKQVRMGSWLLKLLSREIKIKQQKQRLTNKKS